MTESALHCGLGNSVLFIVISLAPRTLPGTQQAFSICSLNKRYGRTQGSETSSSALLLLTGGSNLLSRDSLRSLSAHAECRGGDVSWCKFRLLCLIWGAISTWGA